MAETNSERILKAILKDKELMALGDYNPYDYNTLDDAIHSENIIVETIARLIVDKQKKLSDKEIYTEISNFLQNNL